MTFTLPMALAPTHIHSMGRRSVLCFIMYLHVNMKIGLYCPDPISVLKWGIPQRGGCNPAKEGLLLGSYASPASIGNV
jgi:hypothetical protein